MERKIEYYEEEGIADYVEHLSNSSIDECIESWKDNLDEEINYPCEIVVYGYAEKNKNDYVPSGKEILNDIYDELYNNGFINDYSEEYYTEDLVKCANSLSESIKKDVQAYYEAIKKYKVKIYEGSFEIIEEGDYE